jgi:hypothetical protein
VLVTINNEYCYRERSLRVCLFLYEGRFAERSTRLYKPNFRDCHFFTLFVNKMSIFEYRHVFWEAHSFLAALVNKTICLLKSIW